MARGTLPTRSTKKGGAGKRGTVGDNIAGDGTACEPTADTTVRSRLRAARGGESARSAEPVPEPVSEAARSTTDEPLIPEHVARFFAELPTATHPMQWILQFREALRNVLGDVDRISMSVSLDESLASHHSVPPIEIIQALVTGRRKMVVQTSVTRRSPERLYEAFINRILAPEERDRYHSPTGFDLLRDGGAHLVSVVLLRDRTKPPISAVTIQMVDALRPFLAYAISGMATAYQRIRPAQHLFRRLNQYILHETDLAAREISVLMLQYFGYSYEQIAAMLHISSSTVQQRIKSVHRKTGCTTYLELFGRYVAPELLAAEEAGPERERVVTVM